MPSTSSRGGAPMRRWLPLAVGSGLLLAGCTESRGPTQPAVRGAPTFDSEHGQGPRTHVMTPRGQDRGRHGDRKSTRLNSSHGYISYAVFCLKKKKKTQG